MAKNADKVMQGGIELVQGIVDGILNSENATAAQLLEFLGKESFADILAEIKIGQRWEGVKPAKAAKSGKTEKARETKDGTYNTYTPEERDAQIKLIYQAIKANPKEVTTPEIIEAAKKKWPGMGNYVVTNVLRKLKDDGIVRAIRKNGVKVVRWDVTKKTLQAA